MDKKESPWESFWEVLGVCGCIVAIAATVKILQVWF